ncbi:Bacteriophage lambda head decoration protein D [Marinobacter salarius]|uniref:head decoration protein n=1 Tax=Marinobacter salarius TaxID=1420917 RepID=UPI0012599988|nr:head decoration protein [Marinobacter salarius]VVT02792.1 Head decoration protein [Marinobacter salarius]VXC24974.1 Bacteriophage lambda head decoration protein D [Marinobacter salarius]
MTNFPLAGSGTESFQEDSLVVGGLTDFGNGTLESGQDLVRGTVIGRVTATGDLKISLQTASDGSEKPIGALVHDVDASSAAAACQFVRGGWLNKSLLTWHASWTEALQKSAFDGTPIRLVTPE